MIHRRVAQCALILLLAGCGGAGGPPSAGVPQPAPSPQPRPVADPAPAPASEPSEAPVAPRRDTLPPSWEPLWRRRITPLLAARPWATTNRYDAALVLMLPLHAAFEEGYEPGQREFAEHVARFLQERDSVRLSKDLQLSWLQYFYFLSRFVALAADYDRRDLVPDELPDALDRWVTQLWTREPAWQWRRRPFPGGARERVLWKLADTVGSPGTFSYERAILDQELFLFAIAADLRHYGQRTGTAFARDPQLRDLEQIGLRVYRSRVHWNGDGGWTFQPGAWRDHTDYAYSCHVEKVPSQPTCHEADAAEDASHSHRFPLWLRSLSEAAAPGSEERAYYERLRVGLERQFFTHVAVAPSDSFAGWRMKNFMNGRNGIYRWDYKTLGKDQGYGPYELSGSLILGWWPFLPGPRIREVYRNLAGQFPLPTPQLTLYTGPVPVGKKASRGSGVLVNGTAELLCRLAAELP